MKTEAKNTIEGAKKIGDDVIKMGRNVWLAGLGGGALGIGLAGMAAV